MNVSARLLFASLSVSSLTACEGAVGEAAETAAEGPLGAHDAGSTTGSGHELVTADASSQPLTVTDASVTHDPPPVTPPPSGACSVPADAKLEDVSSPTTVVGTGSPASCTSSAFVAAVAKGGVITFNCGSDPVTITLTETAKVFNDKSQKIVIDGGNKVTLSGGGKVRILYQNTCDPNLVYTTTRCDNQEFPQLTVQNLTFADGNAKGSKEGEGGGAIFASGGRLKVLNSRFFSNVCDDTGPDLGGGAIRTFQQYNDLPVYVVGSTFGGDAAHGNVCSNGGALSSIGVSYTVLNSDFSYNRAIGNGANPAESGTPGGGSGGAIYNDGNTYTLSVCGSHIEHNTANEGGGAIFYVSNDKSGSLKIQDSTLTDNKSGKFETQPGMFVIAKGDPTITNSTVSK